MERDVQEYVEALDGAWATYCQARDPLAVIESIVYIEWLYAKIERAKHGKDA